MKFEKKKKHNLCDWRKSKIRAKEKRRNMGQPAKERKGGIQFR